MSLVTGEANPGVPGGEGTVCPRPSYGLPSAVQDSGVSAASFGHRINANARAQTSWADKMASATQFAAEVLAYSALNVYFTDKQN